MTQNAIIQAFEDAMKHLQKQLRTELKDQGHYLTGALHDSIQYRITKRGSTVVIAEMYALDYALIMEFGVPASRIPFSGSRRGGASGGVSKYIQGLVTFFQKRGLGEREALSAAFATANVQKQEGMPTNDSFAFSANGRRTGFVSETLENDLDVVGKILEERTGFLLSLEFPAAFRMEPLTFHV